MIPWKSWRSSTGMAWYRNIYKIELKYNGERKTQKIEWERRQTYKKKAQVRDFILHINACIFVVLFFGGYFFVPHLQDFIFRKMCFLFFLFLFYILYISFSFILEFEKFSYSRMIFIFKFTFFYSSYVV